MKALLILLSLSTSSIVFGQEICLVTADYQTGENMLIVWEWPASTVGIDSMIVYRKTASAAGFLKIGGTPVGQMSTYMDYTVNTSEWCSYKIAYKYSNGTLSTQSPWHRPILLDYGLQPTTSNYGYISWTEYAIEGLTSTAFVVEYLCYMDQNGIGNFLTASQMPNTSVGWFDQAYAFNPNTVYVVEAVLPNCNINKANINTSRSNIKKQISNAEVGIEALAMGILPVSPNPVEDRITIANAESLESVEIFDQSGKLVYSSVTNQITTEIDLSFLKTGMYIIRARDSKGASFSNKIVKS